MKHPPLEQSVVQLDSSDDDAPKMATKSIIEVINSSSGAKILKTQLIISAGPFQVKEIPSQYNGNIIFELPPTIKECSRMDGMEQRFDGHVWTKPTTTNMSINCVVRLSYCLGSLQCRRIICPHFLSNKSFNECYFTGFMYRKVAMGHLCDDGQNKISCYYCKKSVFCVDTCNCTVYYVLPKDHISTRLMIHIGEHKHNVQSGTSRVAIEKVRQLVRQVLKANITCGPRKMQMIVARELLLDSLMLRQIGEKVRSLGDAELNNILEELMPIVQNQRYIFFLNLISVSSAQRIHLMF